MKLSISTIVLADSFTFANDTIYQMDNNKGLAHVARKISLNAERLVQVIDPELNEEAYENKITLNRGLNKDSLQTFIQIATRCVAEIQNDRPTMKVVTTQLEKALFLQHESLDKYLHKPTLTWVMRLNICIEVASALYFLHGGFGRRAKVIHRDIKTPNILLNDVWKAKLADFGLALISPISKETNYVIDYMCGTPGYVDPVYKKSRILTMESDVYSFGVVLFEILCGRSTFAIYNHEGRYLPEYIKSYFKEEKHNEVVFEKIRKDIEPKSLKIFQKIAYQCLDDERDNRPTIKEVLAELTKASIIQVKMIKPVNEPNVHELFDENIVIKREAKGLPLLVQIEDKVCLCESIGTTKCIDPAIEKTGGVTRMTDIYSFGVVLFEVLCGIHNNNNNNDDRFLGPLGKEHYENNKLNDIIIPGLKLSKKSVERYSDMAYSCLNEDPSSRPSMNYIVQKLKEIPELQLLEYKLEKKLQSLRVPLTNINFATDRFSKTYEILESNENIGLDENWGAKIVGFEDSVVLSINQEGQATKWRRRPSYMDQSSGIDTVKKESDVYSFGVVLFEILCGRSSDDEVYLDKYKKRLDKYKNGMVFVARRNFTAGTIEKMLDPVLKDTPNDISLCTFINIAIQCLEKSPGRRPTMKVVVKELEKALFYQSEENKVTESASGKRKKMRLWNLHLGEEWLTSIPRACLSLLSRFSRNGPLHLPRFPSSSSLTTTTSTSSSARSITRPQPSNSLLRPQALSPLSPPMK
ncbi:hypothetical protein QVD17_31370 [Tagetes erecta]|uniref:Protein kinase domain-containing protein n=1 Tax=Tagetes erecta TaxID=13708 RepID=A0AAD8K7D4_TARER|nr:hypothetical protein QVD17_31370 [Tagetes erecta]